MGKKIESGNSFKFIGKVFFNDKFKEFESKDFLISTIKFSMKCGNNSHLLECTGFKPKDKDKEVHYFYTDRTMGKVKFSERMSIDTENLAFMHSSIKNDDEVFRFVSDYDYVQKLKSMADMGVFNGDNTYLVTGDIDYENYINKKGELVELTKYKPTQFVKVDEDKEHLSTGIFHIYLGSDCFNMIGNEGILTGKSVIRNFKKDENGVEGYDGYETKITIPLGDKDPERAFNILKNRYYGDDNAMNRIGIYAEIRNGTEEVEFDESMLTDDERLLIDLEQETFENIKASKGKGKGDFIRENIRIRESRGYGDGVIETAITLDDLELLERKNSVESSEIFENKEETTLQVKDVEEELTGDEAFDDIFS